MSDQVASAIRSVLKVVGGALVTKGLTDNTTLEALIGGAVALIGIIWSALHHSGPAEPAPATKDEGAK